MSEFVADKHKKTFTIFLEGYPRDGGNFVNDLKAAVSKINPKEYTLVIDAYDLKAFRPKGLIVLEKSYQLYMSFGFREIIMILSSSITCRLQIRRIGNEVGYTGLFAKDRQEYAGLLSQINQK